MQYKLEYLWLDGYKPIANLRSKTKVVELDDFNGEVEKLPEWNFDGSSTDQAACGAARWSTAVKTVPSIPRR